jgi:hypothetical protein
LDWVFACGRIWGSLLRHAQFDKSGRNERSFEAEEILQSLQDHPLRSITTSRPNPLFSFDHPEDLYQESGRDVDGIVTNSPFRLAEQFVGTAIKRGRVHSALSVNAFIGASRSPFRWFNSGSLPTNRP